MSFDRPTPGFAVALVVLSVLSACSDFPEVAVLPADIGPTPALQPIDQLLAQADMASGDPAADLSARAARLRARAAAISP